MDWLGKRNATLYEYPLPASPADASVTVAPSAPSPPPTDNPRSKQDLAYVLIADPDPQRAAMLRDMVELGGYDAVVTRNGDEAKAMLRRRHLPVLVVANLSLPRLDGFALLADLRRLAGSSGPPVVVISSSKELSGAAWNLKERLGVTELLAADATEDDAFETLSRALPSLRRESGPQAVAGSAVAHERWIGETIDHYAADVARRFGVSLVLVSVMVGEQEWLRIHVGMTRRALSQA